MLPTLYWAHIFRERSRRSVPHAFAAAGSISFMCTARLTANSHATGSRQTPCTCPGQRPETTPLDCAGGDSARQLVPVLTLLVCPT